MRDDNLQFKTANLALAKSPRFVVAIIFDVGSIYVTSHDDIPNVPGTVLAGALKRPSAISQRIVADEGRTEIGTFSFDLVDTDSDFTDEIRARLVAGDGLRGRTVQLWYGFRGFDFSAFQKFQTQVVSDCTYDDGVYTVTCQDITRQQRVNIFEAKTTTLTSTCSATDTTINVASTAQFLAVSHGTAWTDGPSLNAIYFKVENEIIRATGKTGTTFTGCTRGEFNTAAAVHTVDSTAPQERRPRVQEFFYLDMPAVKLALALITGVILNNQASPWPASLLGGQGGFETDTNADGVADGWAAFSNDGGRVQVASRPAGSSPFVSVCQRLAITSITNANDSGIVWTGSCRSGLTFTLSAYVRTNASSRVFLLIRYLDANGAILLDTLSGYVASDSIAHAMQVTAVAPTGTEQVQALIRGINAAGQFQEVDQVVLELGSTVHAYTGTPIQGLLPEHWHMGIAPEFVRFADYVGIGTDLWKPSDDTAGFITRFEGLDRQDGKRMLERELYLLLGAFSPIYSDGTLGLRRLPAMVSDAAPVATLTERELISVAPLDHDYSSLHNQIRVTWSYDLGIGDFTRDSLFIDSQSVRIHGEAPLIEFAFRGLHSGVHTEVMIRQRMNAIRDAYSYPPERTSVVARNSLNVYETGDVIRLNVRNVRDFAGAAGDINRSFLISQRSIDFVTGDVGFELFGSTLRPDATGPSAEVTAPLPDAYYTSAGVALNTVIGMTGNNVNAGTHTITGNASLTNSAAIVYHNGDLVIPNGATINISRNVQLRVKGFITLNGTINGAGGGLAGISDPGSAPITVPIDGAPGFIGNSRGWDGVEVRTLGLSKAPEEILRTIPPAIAKGKYDAFPELNLRESGGQLTGLPDDMRGTGGPPGGRTVLSYSSGQIAAGGTGAAGGAGLAIICRGISFGVSALLDLSGADSSNPAKTSIGGFLPDVYPGAGGAGGPGALLIALDGNTLLFPNALGRFRAKTGTVNQAGFPLPTRDLVYSNAYFLSINPTFDPWAGYADEQIVSNLDMSIAALRVVYIPYSQTAAPDQPQMPAVPLGLTATPAAGFNTLKVTLPELGSFDVADIFAAITNDRTGAVLVYRGRGDEFQHNLPVLATRYYWARTTRISDLGLEYHSDFFPASSIGGIASTTLNPGGWTPITTAAGGATMIATSSTLEKSGGTTAWDSQGYSSEKYSACSVSFRCFDATHDFMIGLNTDPATDANYTSIDFAFECAGGSVLIYENGASAGTFGSYTPTTQFAITYDGETVRYLKDGVTQRTVVSPGLILALDSSFYTPGGKAVDLKFQPMSPVTPSNMFVAGGNAAYAGTSIAKIGGSSAWDSDVHSTDGYTEGAFASARCADIVSDAMFGLNSDPTTDQSYTSLDYAWEFSTTGPNLLIYEGGALMGTFGSYSASTVCAIRHVGALVQYIKDGVVVRSVARTATSALYFDSSLYTPGVRLLDVQFGPAGRGAEADPSAVYLETFESPWETTFANVANGTSLTVTYPNDGQFGGKVLKAAGDKLWIQSNENIPFDPSALYRISARIRRTAASGVGGENVFVGVAGVAADGVTLINESGGNSTSSQHYNCARGFDLSTVTVNTWKDFVGWFKGLGTSGFGLAPNNDSPTPLYSGTTFLRPLLILNYNGGNGSMECDFIKIERLVVPDNADNSDRQRLCPDAEFDRSVDLKYWQKVTGSGGGVTYISPTFSLTGGAIAGKATLFGNGTPPNRCGIVGRRLPQVQSVPGQMYTAQLRWRRTAAFSAGTLRAGVVRHQQDQSSSVTFSFVGASDVALGLGAIRIPQSEIAAATVNVWQERNSLVMLPFVSTFAGAVSPYVAAYCQLESAGASDSIEIDFFQVTPGIAMNPDTVISTATTSFSLTTDYLFKNLRHDSAGSCRYDLPAATADMVTAKIYFEQANTGLMTIAPSGSDVLQASPNRTGNRDLAGRYSRAFAEVMAAGVWRIVGQLAP